MKQESLLIPVLLAIIFVSLLGNIYLYFVKNQNPTSSTLDTSILITPTPRSLLKFCPDYLVDNKFPTMAGDTTPPQYFIVNNTRREISEFDSDWVKVNCDLRKETLY